MNYLEKAKNIFDSSGLYGTRICFEQATWSSSDGNIKNYYHIHVQHDLLPDFNSGIGDSDLDKLLIKCKIILVKELSEHLRLHLDLSIEECLKTDKGRKKLKHNLKELEKLLNNESN